MGNNEASLENAPMKPVHYEFKKFEKEDIITNITLDFDALLIKVWKCERKSQDPPCNSCKGQRGMGLIIRVSDRAEKYVCNFNADLSLLRTYDFCIGRGDLFKRAE